MQLVGPWKPIRSCACRSVQTIVCLLASCTAALTTSTLITSSLLLQVYYFKSKNVGANTYQTQESEREAFRSTGINLVMTSRSPVTAVTYSKEKAPAKKNPLFPLDEKFVFAWQNRGIMRGTRFASNKLQ